MQASAPSREPDRGPIDAVIVGAGFAGLYMLHRLRGLGLTVRVYEAAGDVGGTWWWNRYPGARCDVESMQYSYAFSDALQQEWRWSERFSAQPEILRYAGWIADKLDLRRDIRFETRVTRAHFAGQRLRSRFRLHVLRALRILRRHLLCMCARSWSRDVEGQAPLHTSHPEAAASPVCPRFNSRPYGPPMESQSASER